MLEEEEAAGEQPKTQGTVEVGLRGAGQGLFGSGDELEAAARSPMGAIKKLGSRLGLADAADPQIAEYMAKLQEARNANNQAQEQDPLVYGGLQLATGAASMIGGGLPGLALKGAAHAYGASESDDLATQAGEAALGGAIGGVASAVPGLAGQVVAPAVKTAGKLLQKTTPGVAKTAVQGAAAGAAGMLTGPLGAAAVAASRHLIPNSVGRAGAAFAQNAGKATTEAGMKLAERGFSGPVADRIGQTAIGEVLLRAAPDRVMPDHYVLYNTDENYRKVVDGEE